MPVLVAVNDRGPLYISDEAAAMLEVEFRKLNERRLKSQRRRAAEWEARQRAVEAALKEPIRQPVSSLQESIAIRNRRMEDASGITAYRERQERIARENFQRSFGYQMPPIGITPSFTPIQGEAAAHRAAMQALTAGIDTTTRPKSAAAPLPPWLRMFEDPAFVQQLAEKMAAVATRHQVVTRKSLGTASFKAVNGEGLCEAWVNSVGIEDDQGDVLEAGCWGDVIDQARKGDADWPAMLWNHEWGQIVGKVLAAEEYPQGDPTIPPKIARLGAGALKIRGQFNLDEDSTRGRQAWSDARFMAERMNWSVGFLADKESITWKGGTRYIGKVARWPEVSLVLAGASPGTHTSRIT